MNIHYREKLGYLRRNLAFAAKFLEYNHLKDRYGNFISFYSRIVRGFNSNPTMHSVYV